MGKVQQRKGTGNKPRKTGAEEPARDYRGQVTHEGYRTVLSQVVARENRRRANGVPTKLPDVIEAARLEEEQKRYQREALNPLLKRARRQAEKLLDALVALIDASKELPSVETKHRGLMKALDAPVARDAEPISEPTTPNQEERFWFVRAVSSPERMKTFLPWLIATLDGELQRIKGSAGRPPDVAKARATQFLSNEGFGRTRIAKALISEGLDVPAGDNAAARDRIGKRVRRNRRRKGQK